jgi:hypothetical protein
MLLIFRPRPCAPHDAVLAWLFCCLVSGPARSRAYLRGKKQETDEMSKQNNLFQRAVNAIVEGRTRQAERYVAQFERDHDFARKVNGR